VAERTERDDPITLLRDRLIEADLLTQGELEALDQEVRAKIREAVEFADSAPLPEPAELYTHVYSQINEHGRLFFDGRDR
jgi:TPP-dependent pyruvate/acetoin dehydrogenase alpha subunit